MKDEAKHHKDVKPEHIRVVQTNLPVLTAFCGMQPFQGKYEYDDLTKYLKEAEQILAKRSNQITLKDDARRADYIRKNGKEQLLDLKQNNYNLKLEDCVIGADQQKMLNVIDDYIVPRSYLIFLTPQSRMGRAPFYSSEKVIGSWHIKTLWFNIAVMLLMGIIVTLLLLTDCPGKYIRKSNQ